VKKKEGRLGGGGSKRESRVLLWFGGLILRRGESDWRQVEEAQAMR
jgi:hypothetical protein